MISGHPDRLPVARSSGRRGRRWSGSGRARTGSSAYAVALGFLLVLIAVLTTGQ